MSPLHVARQHNGGLAISGFSIAANARCRVVAIVLCVTAVAALSGCASFFQEVSEFQRGWRTTKVEAVGKASDLPSGALTDCRATASVAELASSRFALLTYRVVGGQYHRHIVLVGDQTSIVPGDMVYTNVLICGSELKARPSGR